MATRQRKDFIFRCAYFQRGFRSLSLLLAVTLTLTSSLPSFALKQEAAPEGAGLEELSRRIQKTAPAAAAPSAGLEESALDTQSLQQMVRTALEKYPGVEVIFSQPPQKADPDPHLVRLLVGRIQRTGRFGVLKFSLIRRVQKVRKDLSRLGSLGNIVVWWQFIWKTFLEQKFESYLHARRLGRKIKKYLEYRKNEKRI